MFSWQANPRYDGEDNDHVGDVCEADAPIMGVVHYPEYGYRIFTLEGMTIKIGRFIELVNQFVASCDIPELPKEYATIVSMGPVRGKDDARISLPVAIENGRFNGVPVDEIIGFRIDIPDAMVPPPPTTVRLRLGEVAFIQSIGPRGVLGLSFNFVSKEKSSAPSNIAVADPWTPTHQIVDFWAGTHDRALTEAEHASMCAALDHAFK